MSNSDSYNGGNPDRFLAKTTYERKLAKAGIPRVFWSPDISKVKFHATKFGPDKLSPTAQRQWVKSIVKHSARRGSIVVITSGPTDTGALYLANLITARFAQLGKSSAFIDAAESIPYADDYPYCIVLHNMIGNTAERLQKVRDALLRFQFTFRIVIPVAEDDPYGWCVSKLGKYPTVAIKVSDMSLEA